MFRGFSWAGGPGRAEYFENGMGGSAPGRAENFETLMRRAGLGRENLKM